MLERQRNAKISIWENHSSETCPKGIGLRRVGRLFAGYSETRLSPKSSRAWSLDPRQHHQQQYRHHHHHRCRRRSPFKKTLLPPRWLPELQPAPSSWVEIVEEKEGDGGVRGWVDVFDGDGAGVVAVSKYFHKFSCFSRLCSSQPTLFALRSGVLQRFRVECSPLLLLLLTLFLTIASTSSFSTSSFVSCSSELCSLRVPFSKRGILALAPKLLGMMLLLLLLFILAAVGAEKPGDWKPVCNVGWMHRRPFSRA